MTDGAYTDDEPIKHLTALEAIRCRPGMYIGGPNFELDPHVLVMEALCLAWANACDQCASRIHIDLTPTHDVVIWDDGPGLDVTKQLSDTHSLIRAVFTESHACRDAKTSLRNRDLCRVGIVVVTALSKNTIYETAQDGFLWRQVFSPDSPDSPLEQLTPTTDRWQRVTFNPDSVIFGDQQVTVAGVRSVFQKALTGTPTKLQPKLPAASASLTVTDQISGETVSLNSAV